MRLERSRLAAATLLAALTLTLTTPAAAERPLAQGPREVAFSDPSRPGVLRAELAAGRLVVRGVAGSAVRVSDPGRARLEERDNVVRLTIGEQSGAGAAAPGGDIVVEVPPATTVHVTATRQASVGVEAMSGETRATTDAGSIALSGLTGRVAAESQTGAIVARFDAPPREPLAFTTRTGDLEVTLPPGSGVDVRLDHVEGEFTSDFYMEMLPSEERQIVDDRRAEGGRFHIKIEKTLRGRIGEGGPELAIRTVSGAIRLKQAR
jgi:hypothetical protein